MSPIPKRFDKYELAGEKEPFSVPLLYDKNTKSVVSSDSLETLKILNFEFNEFSKNPDLNLFPDSPVGDKLQELHDSLVYPKVIIGVYRCGFVKTQKVYDTAMDELLDSFQILEDKLSNQRFLGGNDLSWLDVRLFNTLLRFDPVYVTYFKTNEKRLVDYPTLLAYTRDIYQSFPAIRDSVSIDHIKKHYYTSHPVLNTYGIIPRSNGPDLTVPSGRDEKFV